MDQGIVSERSEQGDVMAGIGFYRPLASYTLDEGIAMLSSYHGLLEKAEGFLQSAVVKSHDGSVAAAYALWKRGTSLQGIIMIPELDMLYEELDSRGSVDVLLYDVEIIGSKIGLPPSLSSSHVVTVRELNVSEVAYQEKLMECGFTVLNGSFSSSEVLFSSLHKSLDGEKIVEIGVWEHKEAAEAAAMVNYWEGLVLSQELHTCDIVYTPNSTGQASTS